MDENEGPTFLAGVLAGSMRFDDAKGAIRIEVCSRAMALWLAAELEVNPKLYTRDGIYHFSIRGAEARKLLVDLVDLWPPPVRAMAFRFLGEPNPMEELVLSAHGVRSASLWGDD